MRVYLAGPMTGIKSFNIPAFEDAAQDLRGRGYDVVSPVELDGPVDREVLMASETGSHDDLPPDADYESYLQRDFELLRSGTIEGIICLPGWEESGGAQREVALARELGIPRGDYTGPWAFVAAPWTAPKAAVKSTDSVYDGDHFVRHDENPLRQREVTGAVKDNRGKSRVDLIPSKPLVGVGLVLAAGAAKYKPNNWRLGLRWSDTMASIQRHLLAFADGEDLDPETGLPHIDQALCQTLFLSEYYHSGTGTDDRWSSLTPEQRGEARA